MQDITLLGVELFDACGSLRVVVGVVGVLVIDLITGQNSTLADHIGVVHGVGLGGVHGKAVGDDGDEAADGGQGHVTLNSVRHRILVVVHEAHSFVACEDHGVHDQQTKTVCSVSKCRLRCIDQRSVRDLVCIRHGSGAGSLGQVGDMAFQPGHAQNAVQNRHEVTGAHLPIVASNGIPNVSHGVSTGQLTGKVLCFPRLHALDQHTGLLAARHIDGGVIGLTVVVKGLRISLVDRGVERQCRHVALLAD